MAVIIVGLAGGSKASVFDREPRREQQTERSKPQGRYAHSEHAR